MDNIMIPTDKSAAFPTRLFRRARKIFSWRWSCPVNNPLAGDGNEIYWPLVGCVKLHTCVRHNIAYATHMQRCSYVKVLYY